MSNTDQPHKDTELLLEAFNTFSEASLQLEKAYAELQEHTRSLDSELAATNEKLRHSLLEEEAARLHLKGILDTLSSGILVIDLEGKVLEVNPCAERLLRVTKQAVHYSKLDLPQAIYQFIYDCLDSTMPRVPKSAVTIVHDGEVLDLDLTFSLVRPQGGGILSVLILIEDKTLINRLQSQSRRNVRLAAMGEMAAELAHEIRNPLGSIKLFASLLESDLQEHLPDKAELAHQISSGVSTLENIVSNILAFSADVKPKRSRLSVTSLMHQSLTLFELERNRKRIQLEIREPQGDAFVNGDEHLLKQALLNLCSNAIKAMEPGGTLSLIGKVREGFVELEIKDTGHGIPPELLPKIFDPFVTTFQGGTGLGLSVVNQIIDKHDGALDISSTVGEGTSIFLSLPLYPEAKA